MFFQFDGDQRVGIVVFVLCFWLLFVGVLFVGFVCAQHGAWGCCYVL